MTVPSSSVAKLELELSARLEETFRASLAKGAPRRSRVGIVLGSGLGAFADTLKGVQIPYAELPHMPTSGVQGHAGKLCFGDVGGVPVVCMKGRAHYYEGHSIDAVVHGARLLAKLGVASVLLTNAAGGIDPAMSAGDLMVIEDHLNLAGVSPLRGTNDDSLGPRFPDMTAAYDAEHCAALVGIAAENGILLRRGVYAWVSGPSYETPAEVRMLRALGAHAVGMSTVPEVLALRHMGVRVGALSCITNLAAGVGRQRLDHRDVERTAMQKKDELLTLLSRWVPKVAADG